MNRITMLASLAALLVIAGCARRPEDTSKIASFDAFVAATGKASAKDYLGKPGVRVTGEAEFGLMKDYLLERYRGMHVKHSFHGSEGAFIDCVPFGEQPSLRGVAAATIERKAPTLTGTPTTIDPSQHAGEFTARQAADATLKAGVKDELGNERFCQGDTIPIMRITLEQLVQFATLEGFFHKGEVVDGVLIPGGESHYYAVGRQQIANSGADSWLNVWSPKVADKQMSLSQIWVTGGDGDGKQTIEVGWQVYPGHWHSDNAALFIFHTIDNYKKGKGCYNTDCDGFVQVANNVYLGSGFDHYSSIDGGQWGFEIQVQRADTGSWWLFYRGPGAWIPFGYFPRSVFGEGILSRQAERFTVGGETTGEASAKEMGSGRKAAEHFGKAAFQNGIFYIDANRQSHWGDLFKIEPDPTCYTTEINNVSGAWGTYLYFGGPSCN
jgi:Neprosin